MRLILPILIVCIIACSPDSGDVRSRVALQAECNNGHIDPCFELGKMHLEGRGGPRDMSLARRFFEQACDEDHPKACNNFGLLLRDGNGGPQDEARAMGVFEKACKMNNGQSCAHFASLCLNTPSKQPQARKALRTACDLHLETACYTFAVLSEKGVGGPVDLAMAWWGMHQGCRLGSDKACEHMKTFTSNPRALNETACRAGNMDACLLVGEMADNGYYGPRDRSTAKAHYEAACRLGSATACNNAGEMWIKGVGGPVHEERAKWYFRLACREDEPKGCANLALLSKWDGKLSKARSTYEKACKLNEATSCAELAWFWRWGWGGKRDAGKADALTAAACRLGLNEACPRRRTKR